MTATPHVYEQTDFQSDQETLTEYRIRTDQENRMSYPSPRPTRCRLPFAVALMVAAAALMVAATLALGAQMASAQETPTAEPVCHEDMPCWQWSKMGNRKRGIVTAHGTPLVVGPCKFRALYRAGAIRYSMVGLRLLDPLHGDVYATSYADCPRTAPIPARRVIRAQLRFARAAEPTA